MLKANIIGTGIMGSAVAQVLAREPRVKMTAACNRSPMSLDVLHEAFRVEPYRDYVEMLDAESPDVVFIATPDWAHYEPVMACLDRGIHVFVEKPITTDVAGAEAITKKVAETGLKLQVSYNHRWLAPYHLTHTKIKSGEIGRPLVGYARKNNPITVPTEMLASWAKDSSPMWWDTWDALQGQLRFKQGGVATFEASWIYPESHPSMPDSFMSVVGEQGHLQVDRKDEAVEMSSEGGFSWPRSLLNAKVFDRWVGAFPSSIASFIDAVEQDREPYVTARDGWRVTAVLDAFHRAAESGRPVSLPTLSI